MPARQARDDTVEGRPPVAVPDRARRTSARAPGDGPGVVGGRAERVCRERLVDRPDSFISLANPSYLRKVAPTVMATLGDREFVGFGGLRHLVLRSAARGHRRLP